jgi:hypothetical protein
LPDGKAPAHGGLFKPPDLAKTFRKIAKEGPGVFYRGEPARVLATYIEARGDFVSEVEPSQSKPSPLDHWGQLRSKVFAVDLVRLGERKTYTVFQVEEVVQHSGLI